MNKTELVDAVAEKTAQSKKTVTQVLDSILGTVTERLSASEQVVFVGFGTFSLKHRAARKGVNPQTGASIDIKASNVPSFKSGKLLKEACNLPAETVE